MPNDKGTIQTLIDNIAKQASTSVSRLSDDSSPCVVTGFLSTGCYLLDAAMGGGLPLGRVVEIYGDTSTGKSLIAAQACATIQDEGGVALYIDTETAVSLPIMEAVGVDIDNLVYTAPDTVEQVFKTMEVAIKSKADYDLLIVWDSVAATSSTAEMDKETGEVGYLTHARVISQGLRRLTRLISKENVAVLLINQAKENIGVMFGSKVTTFGGKAVGFHSSIRVMLKVGQKIKRGDKRVIGIYAKATITKNKIAPPFRTVSLPIYFGHGVDEAEAALEYLRLAKALTISGGWYEFAGQRFRKNGWPAIFDDEYDEICNLIDDLMEGEDLL